MRFAEYVDAYVRSRYVGITRQFNADDKVQDGFTPLRLTVQLFARYASLDTPALSSNRFLLPKSERTLPPVNISR